MSATVLSKVSTPCTKANFSSELLQKIFSSMSGLSSCNYGVKNMKNIEWFLRILFSFVLMDK